VRRTGGEVCLQVGRLQAGRIGSLGQDGAWGDDRAFHPFPLTGPDASGGPFCATTDGRGDAFLNPADYTATASAFGSVLGSPRDHCIGSSSTGKTTSRPVSCPVGDQRALAFGLLGPDATSVTYHGAGGRLITEPTSGPDGAYLVVTPHRLSPCEHGPVGGGHCSRFAGSVGALLQTGIITRVTYRGGQVCRLPVVGHAAARVVSCPPRGYSPLRTRVDAEQVATPVSVKGLGGRHYCPSTRPASAHCTQFILALSFTARVAVTSPRSYYEYVVKVRPSARPTSRAGCPGTTGEGMTTTDLHAGERVRQTYQLGQLPAGCSGRTVYGTVAFMADAGLGIAGYESRPVLVGTFRSTVP
jgi:hypothetical protein